MLSVLAFIFVFGILIFVHEFGHFLSAKRNGVRVEKFSFGFGPKLFGKKVGETEYLISAVPLGGYIKMAGDQPGQERQNAPWEFLSKSCGQRAQVVAAGPILNYLLAFLLFYLIFIIGSPTITTRVGDVLDDYPAKQAGIKEQDIILAVDGEKVAYWPEMAQLIHQKTEGQTVILDIKRKERLLKIKLRPQIKESEDIFGKKVKIALAGIAASDETTTIKYGWGQSFYKAGEKLLSLTGMTYKALGLILVRRLSWRESMGGPIMIFSLTGKVAKLGLVPLLNFMGVLSMALAIFNFLPIPVLDGGHLFFILIEKLRKKALTVRVQEVATQLGLMLLIFVMLFVSYNDLMRIGLLEKIADWWKDITPK